MDLAEATDKIRSRLGSASHINARVKFDFGDDGVIFWQNFVNSSHVKIVSHFANGFFGGAQLCGRHIIILQGLIQQDF